MKKKTIFPALPDKLSELSPEELEAFVTEHEALLLKVRSRDEETLGDLSMGEVLAQAKEAKDALAAVRAEIEDRGAAEAQFEEELAKITEEAGIKAEAEGDDDGDGDDTGDDAEPAETTETAEAAEAEVVVEDAPEPVLASGGQRAAKPRPPMPSKDREPLESQDSRVALVASSGIPGYGESQVLDRMDLAGAIIAKNSQGVSSAAGVQEKVLVARADFRPSFPESRKLDGSNPSAITDALEEVEAMTASGGLCAPVTPYYELMNLSTPARPVRDALAGFQATRGGLQFAAPATLADVVESVGIKTADEDAQGGTYALKNCLPVVCPDFETRQLEMIYRCLQFGNLNARTFPELIAQWTDLSIAYHARVAESALLDYIGSVSTPVTQAQVYGATATIVDSILFGAAGMRSRHRMDPNARFRAIFPAWTKDLLAADSIGTQFQRGDVKPGDVEGLLNAYGITVSWHLDTETGEGQIIGTQSAGVLLDLPATLVYYLFPEGSFLFLDGGTLDLGIVRDSLLNSTNDFQIFAETFESSAFVGVESLKVEAAVCPTGSAAGLTTPITCA